MNSFDSITSLPERPDDERRRRVVNYSIAMGIRVVCVILCVFVTGWWLVVPILGAVVLPYVAVVFANVATRQTGNLTVPGQFALSSGPTYASPDVAGERDRATR
jgi:hypothetical protein